MTAITLLFVSTGNKTIDAADFNTLETLSHIGSMTNEISMSLLKEIGRYVFYEMENEKVRKIELEKRDDPVYNEFNMIIPEIFL